MRPACLSAWPRSHHRLGEAILRRRASRRFASTTGIFDNPSKLARFAVYVGLCAFALSPLLWVRVPPLVDYPNHLARMWILDRSHLLEHRPLQPLDLKQLRALDLQEA